MQRLSQNCAGVVIAVDTDVVIRLLTGDDPQQFARVRKLFATETVFLPKTVVLEAEWVLRSLYGFDPQQIADALTALVALPQLHVEDSGVIVDAVEWLRQGLDFADALHLASSQIAQQFASFDRAFVRSAKAAGSRIVVSAP